ncbi:MAG TPA: hypothetical protein VJV79_25530 [Polyangiaceae bacterium]|nr:hypothetical protein [Polyangiaceae bacterium]
MTNVSERATSQPREAVANALNTGFRHLLEVHGEVFALVKRLGMRSDDHVRQALEPSVNRLWQQREEMAELHAALRQILHTDDSAVEDDEPSDLAEAMAALDAMNPSSPEWGPAFLQVSELVEAHASE